MRLLVLYESAKDALAHDLGLSHPILHVHVGLGLYVAAALLLRSFSSPWPLIAVAVAEAVNEALDRMAFGSWRFADTAGDVANSLFWPLVLFIAVRWLAPPGKRRR